MLLAKQEIVYFLFKCVPTGQTYSFCWEGKNEGYCGSLGYVFFFTVLLGSITVRYTSRGPLMGWQGQNRKRLKETRSCPNPAFNHCSDTMETRPVTETSWSTETLKGSENKWLSVDMKYSPVVCLQIITHFYYLHISWPCFCYRMTNRSNGTLVKWRLILETSTRRIVCLTLVDFVPTVINGM